MVSQLCRSVNSEALALIVVLFPPNVFGGVGVGVVIACTVLALAASNGSTIIFTMDGIVGMTNAAMRTSATTIFRVEFFRDRMDDCLVQRGTMLIARLFKTRAGDPETSTTKRKKRVGSCANLAFPGIDVAIHREPVDRAAPGNRVVRRA